ncbi:hypothetical protein [Streptomyces sp. E-08]
MITYLIDTSAYVHLGTDPAAERRWDAEIETGARVLKEVEQQDVRHPDK